jgi:beta-lactamase superfamily II metal-dependent hydrolase
MDFVIDFVYVGDGDAIIIWAREPNKSDFVFFLDGGDAGNGQKVVDHYRKWIEPNLQSQRAIGFINSHPHEDHIDGLLEIVDKLGSTMSFAIYNDPVECITAEHKDRLYRAYMKGEDPDITHLYQEFEQIEKLNGFCKKYNLKRYNAYNNINFWNGQFRILMPSEDFYVNEVQYFADEELLKAKDFSVKPEPVDISQDDSKPCEIVDESDDTTPENLTSTVIQLTDSKGKKYILTADAGVASFDYMESYFDATNIAMVQLPHHGSRRNVSARWINKFNPGLFMVSAEGNNKHPRRAVINCIKRHHPNCNVYSSHVNQGGMCYMTNKDIFPSRGWGQANSI